MTTIELPELDALRGILDSGTVEVTEDDMAAGRFTAETEQDDDAMRRFILHKAGF